MPVSDFSSVKLTHDLLTMLLKGVEVPSLEMVSKIINTYYLVKRQGMEDNSSQTSADETPPTPPNSPRVVVTPVVATTAIVAPPPPPAAKKTLKPLKPGRVTGGELIEARMGRHNYLSDLWYSAAGGVKGSMAARDHLIKELGPDITQWRKLYESKDSHTKKNAMLFSIKAWSSFTNELSENDAAECYKLLGESKGKIMDGEHGHTEGLEIFKEKFETIDRLRITARSTADPATIDKWAIFGAVLPPRRAGDLEHLIIVDTAADATDENTNFFAKDTSVLCFRFYKTMAKFGVQTYDLTKPDELPFCDAVDVERARVCLQSQPLGNMYKTSNFNLYFSRHNAKLCCNDFRHYYSTKFRTSERRVYLHMCKWLTHSVESDILGYSIE